jgi:membrane-bound lytic murein transglycosylase D
MRFESRGGGWWVIRSMGRVLANAALVAVAVSTAVGARAAATEFSVPPGLKTQVEFWKQIFGVYSTQQVLIHDAWRLDRVYEVLDFQSLGDGTISDATVEGYIQERVRDEKERIRAILVRLHQLGPEPEGLSDEERKIWAMFGGDETPSKFLDAAAEDRIRAQRGLRERFAAGVEVSRRYLPEMEAVFRREGVPVALTRLPLVESCFNVRAYSKVGAAGIWQFMPSTGRHYLRIDDAVDERRDPVASTAAAAAHLRANYEVLDSWPLAITAYNHGRAGMARAVATVGSTDLVDIIEHYHGPAFKFASRNFYAEFLAALDVEQHSYEYFGELSPHRPPRTETVVLPDFTTLKAAARAVGTDADTLADLNPALTREVLSGRLHVPKGYRLRVPPGGAAEFQTRYASISAAQKQDRPHQGRAAHRVTTHRVQKGQTLQGIAKRYGTTVAAIRRRNKLSGTAGVKAGQSLIIPAG